MPELRIEVSDKQFSELSRILDRPKTDFLFLEDLLGFIGGYEDGELTALGALNYIQGEIQQRFIKEGLLDSNGFEDTKGYTAKQILEIRREQKGHIVKA